jgi:hypothetical protein
MQVFLPLRYALEHDLGVYPSTLKRPCCETATLGDNSREFKDDQKALNTLLKRK